MHEKFSVTGCQPLTGHTIYYKRVVLQVLSRALDRAAPQLLKYILFVAILFMAFMLCGWLVLSPYHRKVSQPRRTLMNIADRLVARCLVFYV